MDVVSEIKSKIAIEELVSPYAQLIKAGRHFKALCPFHNEKTPSFFVSPEKQLAYCFGCHRGGDVFKFIQEIERIDFPEALKLLAEKAGVPLPKTYEAKEKGKRRRLLDMHDFAKEWFVKNLWETKEGEKVLAYAKKKRDLKEETIRKFELGFAPASENALVKELLNKGFSKEEILESGLAARSRISGTEIIDRFVGRLIFPIFDGQGQVLAFGGRALKEGQEPKYLNSPDTPIYHKGSILYGIHAAKERLRKENKVLIVEGYMDVIRCHEAGFENAVGVCGTALTPEQLRGIKRFVPAVILFFDGDEAGRQATTRAFGIASSENLMVSVIRPEKGKDPDLWIRDSQKDFEETLQSPQDFFEFLFSDLKAVYSFQNPQEKQKALLEILPFLTQVKGRIEQDSYIQRLAGQLSVKPSFIYDEMARVSKVPYESRETFSKKTGKLLTEEYLIGCFIQYPETWQIAKSQLSVALFSGEQNQLYKILEDTYNIDPIGGENFISRNIPEELQEKAKFLAFFAETQNSTLTFDEIFEEVKKGSQKFLREKISEKKKDLQKLIAEAERNRDHKEISRLLTEYQSILIANR